jgi:hypothetical protein
MRAFGALRRSEAILIRAEAAHFHSLSDGEQLRKLSFATAADLARELLGVPERTARERVALHRACVKHPALEKLFLDGRLSSCHLLAIAPLLDRPEAAAWVKRALEAPVRQLRREIRRQEPGAYHEERHGQRRIEIDLPVAIKAELDTMIEVGRMVIGYDAPPGEVIEAILLETGRAGRGYPGDLKSRGKKRSRRPPLRLVRPYGPVSTLDRAEAEALIEEAAAFRRRLAHFTGARAHRRLESARVHPTRILEDLVELRSMHNPLRVLLARLVRSMRRTRCDVRLGFDTLESFVADRLDLTDRFARELVSESFLFEHHPALARAYSGGRISIAKAHLVAGLTSGGDIDRWIDRAADVFHRPFERECRLISLVRAYDPKIARTFSGPFPHYGMDRILFDHVRAKHGWTAKQLERELKHRHIRRLPARGSLDPARNPSLLRRLEVLVLLLCAPAQPAPESEKERRMFAVREPHIRFSFGCSEEVAADLHALHRDFERVHGPLAQSWVPLILAIKEATDAWLEQDPGRVPIRDAILRRDGYHCVFPGCGRRATLEGNHIHMRSRGGRNHRSNIITLCAVHHRYVFHRGYARITGTAPDDLRFEIGVRPDGRPLLVTHGNLIVERNYRWQVPARPEVTPRSPSSR